MLKTLSAAAFVGAFALASMPAVTSTAFAQGTGPDVPSAPAPADAKDSAMSKSSMSKGSMKKGGSMKSKKSMSMKKKKM